MHKLKTILIYLVPFLVLLACVLYAEACSGRTSYSSVRVSTVCAHPAKVQFVQRPEAIPVPTVVQEQVIAPPPVTTRQRVITETVQPPPVTRQRVITEVVASPPVSEQSFVQTYSAATFSSFSALATVPAVSVNFFNVKQRRHLFGHRRSSSYTSYASGW